jgi:hypothetical protein
MVPWSGAYISYSDAFIYGVRQMGDNGLANFLGKRRFIACGYEPQAPFIILINGLLYARSQNIRRKFFPVTAPLGGYFYHKMSEVAEWARINKF